MKTAQILTLMGLVAAGPAFATDAPRPAGYPQEQGASVEQQADIGPLVERLRTEYGKRLAGLYFEEPDRLVVRLTGEKPVEAQTHRIGAQQLEVVFRPGAAHTYAQLAEALEKSDRDIDRLLPETHGRYVDEKTGEVVVAVRPGTSVTDKQRAELEKAIGAPVRVELEEPAVLQRSQ
ncbi:S1 family peptidase [Pseudomonas aeruginosa]|nr:S1 family peptidase [Pseudomonas aeruginosa]